MPPTTIFPTLREAIHHTTTRSGIPMKQIAAELDWSPSMLSFATTLGQENVKAFPADDAHLVKLMEVTGDDSILATLAFKRGYELVPKRDRMPEVLAGLHEDFKSLGEKLQMVLEMPGLPTSRKRSGAR